MGRSFQGYLLIAVMSLSVTANLATVLAGTCGRSGACQSSCCGSANCPMRSHGDRMPMKCPMSSRAGNDRATKDCCCSMSPQKAPVVPASLFELRYDLPRTQGFLMRALTAYRAAETVAVSLDGFFSPPDQPPRALQF